MDLESTLWRYRATLLGWVDGDTFSAELALGFMMTTTQRLRLIGSAVGVDTPEMHSQDPRERAAAKAAKQRVEGLLPAGSPCYVITRKPGPGEPDGGFGRYLAQLILPDGCNVGDLLLAEGLAVPYRRGQ
jgi:micrococcal nuclease